MRLNFSSDFRGFRDAILNNVWVFHSGIWLTVKEWDLAPVTPRRARIAGYASLCLWASIVVTGRMIAFNWFD